MSTRKLAITSVMVAMLLSEPHSSAADQFFLHSQEPWLLSEFAAAEVASALSRLVRTGALDAKAATA